LAEIVNDPAAARVAPEVQDILARLLTQAGGALAVISGRSIAQIDQILYPLHLPAAGVHGLEERITGGHVNRLAFDGCAHVELVATVNRFTSTHDGLRAEPKPGAVALHYRERPDLAQDCLQFMKAQTLRDPRLTLLTGKMVAELIFGRKSKGEAVAGMMQAAPFAGRRAVYAGDDVTDEAAFQVVNRMGGISIKIGTGQTCATYRLPDPAALAGYLAALTEPKGLRLEHLPA
jgi:trehalose 6-phosphate phosphatase